ncbi:hypothetical protein [Pseudoalteromonas sp.]|uniref:hypothetical protein n=1 Tax=Pseudoalteromonas sp. TaxID=53249 RepID=UPI001BCB54B3|nr:hypothetical protein [Pseudoalteromonas sp.]
MDELFAAESTLKIVRPLVAVANATCIHKGVEHRASSCEKRASSYLKRRFSRQQGVCLGDNFLRWWKFIALTR